MAQDYGAIAATIVEKLGGESNIRSVTHCMTRLRIYVNNLDKADLNAVGEIPGVLGCVYGAEQVQVILGMILLDVYDKVITEYNFEELPTIQENLDAGQVPAGNANGEKRSLALPLRWGKAFLDYIAASVTPMISGLLAGGMMKVGLLFATLAMPDFANTTSYALLTLASDAPFYFMPIWVAYGAAMKLGATPIYAMLVAAAMIAPKFIEMVAAGNPLDILGIPVALRGYTSTLLPALLAAYAAFRFEKLWNKLIPALFRTVFVGMLTVTCTYALTMVFLAPLGGVIGDVIVDGILVMQGTVGPLAVGVLAAAQPFLIMSGMHLFSPLIVQSLSDLGYDAFFRPALIFHNMAEGGACLGVALRAKSRELRSYALSTAIGCIVAGISEPSIYGICMKYKRPLVAVVAGALAGGVVCGLFGARVYSMGTSNILALPIFEDTVMTALIAVLVSIGVSAVVAFVLGIDEGDVPAKKAK